MADTLTLKMGELPEFLSIMIDALRPVFIHGEPGLGKTAVINEVVNRKGRRAICKIAAQMDATDISGVPMPSADGKTTNFLHPEWIPQDPDDDSVIFWDELPNAVVMVHNSVQKLIHDRELNGIKLPARVTHIAAGNRVQDRAGANKLTTAMNSRFVHVTVVDDLDFWVKNFALKHDVDPIVIAFLRYRPNLFHAFDKDAQTFPCARTWDFCSDIVKQNPSAKMKMALFAGAVGYTAAVEFAAFEKLYRELQATSIEAILLNPDAARVPTEPSGLYAVTSALARVANKENFGRVVKYWTRLPKEYMFMGMSDLMTIKPELQSTPEFTRWVGANSRVLTGV